MSKAAADDFEGEHVSSTALSGHQALQDPPSAKELNACKTRKSPVHQADPDNDI